MKKIIIILIVIAAAVLLGIKGKGLLEKRKLNIENTPLPLTESITVRTIKPIQGRLENKIPMLAQVMPIKSIKLSTKLTGYIEKIMVEESQKIQKGDLLIHIDSKEIQSNIQSLQIALDTQKSDLSIAQNMHERNKKLYDIGGFPKEKLELSGLTLEVKSATIKSSIQKIAQLEHQLSYLSIRAPFDAQVDAILLQEGDLAVTGKPILALSTTTKKLIISYAPDAKLGISVGEKVFLENREIGIIKLLYNTSNNGLKSAEISLSEEILAPTGSSISIDILTKSFDGCMVPEDSILHKKEGEYIMTYSNDGFMANKVKVLIENSSKAIISPCPNEPIARASETVLSSLPAYTNIKVIGEANAQQ